MRRSLGRNRDPALEAIRDIRVVGLARLAFGTNGDDDEAMTASSRSPSSDRSPPRAPSPSSSSSPRPGRAWSGSTASWATASTRWSTRSGASRRDRMGPRAPRGGGAFAAAAEAQLTGRLAVCAGSCGPGNMHLINGLYDANRTRRAGAGHRLAHPQQRRSARGFFQETHPDRLFIECRRYCEMISTAAAGAPGDAASPSSTRSARRRRRRRSCPATSPASRRRRSHRHARVLTGPRRGAGPARQVAGAGRRDQRRRAR